MIFSQSSPSYTTLRPIGAPLPTPDTGGDTAVDGTPAPGETVPLPTEPATGTVAPEETVTADGATEAETAAADDDGGGGNGVVIGIVIAALAVLGIGGFAVAKRRKSADERE